MFVKFFTNDIYRPVPGYQTLKEWWRKEEDTDNDVVIVLSKRPLRLGLCYRDDIIYDGTSGDFRLKTSYIFNLKDIQESSGEKGLQDFAKEEEIWLSEYIKKFPLTNTKLVYSSEIESWHRLSMYARQLRAYLAFLREKPPPLSMDLPLCLYCDRPTADGEIKYKQPLCNASCQEVYYNGRPSSSENESIFVLNMEEALSGLAQKRHILYTDEHIQLSIQRLKKKGSKVTKEIHNTQSQFIRVEKGSLTVIIYTRGHLTTKVLKAQGEDSIMIPANRFHILKNETEKPVLFYTIYAPPAHTMEEMQQDAEEARTF